MTTTPCSKCNGSGYLSVFAHYAGGVCFACSGSGRVAVRKAPATRQPAGRAAHIAAQEARWAAFAEFAPEIAADLLRREAAEVEKFGYIGQGGEIAHYVRFGTVDHDRAVAMARRLPVGLVA